MAFHVTCHFMSHVISCHVMSHFMSCHMSFHVTCHFMSTLIYEREREMVRFKIMQVETFWYTDYTHYTDYTYSPERVIEGPSPLKRVKTYF